MHYSNILLIDDDDDDQEIFLAAVDKISKSVSCLAFGNAEKALAQLVKRAIVPDVIFLDLNMPIMNGQQFLVELKKDNDLKAIPVIIFSTSANKDTISQTKALGAADFITKPARFNELVSILTPLIS